MPAGRAKAAAWCGRKRNSVMDQARLITMANQIARNLAPQGEVQAIELTAQHLRDYWDRRMRAAIRRCDAAELNPIARAAVAMLDS